MICNPVISGGGVKTYTYNAVYGGTPEKVRIGRFLNGERNIFVLTNSPQQITTEGTIAISREDPLNVISSIYITFDDGSETFSTMNSPEMMFGVPNGLMILSIDRIMMDNPGKKITELRVGYMD